MTRRPRRGESPQHFVAREVRREHRPPRSWPPVLGGVLAVGALAVGYGLIDDPARASEWVQVAVFAAWWGGFGLGCLGTLVCTGLNRLMSALLVAAAVTFTAGGMLQWW